MLSREEIKKKYIEYLGEAGINQHVLKYLEKNIYLLMPKLKEIIGSDLIPIYKDKYIEQLKQGSETFKITEDGGVWWIGEHNSHESSVSNKIKVYGQVYNFYSNGITLDDENIEKSYDYNYITSSDNMIIHKNLRLKQGNKNDRTFYNGNIIEKTINQNLDVVEQTEATWENEETKKIPNRELLVTQKIYGSGYFSNLVQEHQTYYKNFQENLDWQFVISGKTQGQKLQEQIEGATKKSNIIIDGVKQFFNKLRNKTRDIEK